MESPNKRGSSEDPKEKQEVKEITDESRNAEEGVESTNIENSGWGMEEPSTNIKEEMSYTWGTEESNVEYRTPYTPHPEDPNDPYYSPSYNLDEEDLDFDSLKYLRKEKVSKEIDKLITKEGKGSKAGYEGTVWYKHREYLTEGTLLNKATRGNVSKIGIRNHPKLTGRERGMMNLFKTVKSGEEMWVVLRGKSANLEGIKEYQELKEEGKQLPDKIYIYIEVERVKHSFPEEYNDYPSLMGNITRIRELAKEYVTLQETEFAYDFYHKGFMLLSSMKKEVKQKLSTEEMEEVEREKVILANNKCQMALNLHRFAECKRSAEYVLERDKDNIKGLMRLGKCCHLLGIKERAIANFKRVLKLEPGNKDVIKYKPYIKQYETDKAKEKTFCKKYKEELEREEKDKELREKIRRKEAKERAMYEANIAKEVNEQMEEGIIISHDGTITQIQNPTMEHQINHPNQDLNEDRKYDTNLTATPQQL